VYKRQAQVDRVVPELANDPAIAALVRAQVNQVVPLLAQDPAIQELIRQQGDAYIDYLNEHPDAVQNLIQGQSVSLASDVLDGVRERTVTADSLAESIVRGLLGRKPRGDVPEPPEQIQRRAVSAMLPSDYVEEGDR
jgi:hypothetical protein